MSADKDDPPGGPARTVFMPSIPPHPGAPAADPAPPAAAPPPPEDRAAEDAWFSGEADAPPAPAAPPQGSAAPPEPPPATWDDAPPSSLPQQDWAATPPPAPPPPPSPLAGPPGWDDPQPAAYAWPANQSQPASPPSDVWGPDTSAPPPPSPQNAGRIAVGSILNNIYEVRRFIARGGMGEVYEGVNTHTDERVAIKVMLSHLAEDPNVQAMFRKEARTLTRLSHPALVQYRVLAQEPALKAFYIVTEFIDGAQLADVIGKVQPDAAELEQLTRRLAAGLNAAHELGAIHRDMSPDNVLLPAGRLDQAKVIDFGIAKDLDPSNKTIVGDGFAGKMGFVAPEQFGDYGREVGPWTDIYSLALVILAVANGKPVDMGATLVDAIDKRRAGPSLDCLPERLRPTFAGMLAPDPANRFRSMAEVLNALDQSVGRPAPVSAAPPPRPAAEKGKPPKPPRPPKPTGATAAAPAKGGMNPAVLIGGGVAALVVLGGLVFVMLPKGKPAATTTTATTAATTAPVATAATTPAGGGAEAVRQAVEAALPAVACTWMDVDDVGSGSGGVSLRLSGVANSPAEAQAAVSKAAGAGGAQVGLVDASNVFPIAKPVCAPLDTFRGFRKATSANGRGFVSQQSNWEIQATNPPCPDGAFAKVLVNLKLDDPSSDFTIVGLESSGAMQQLYKDRATFESYAKQAPDLYAPQGPGAWRTTVCNDKAGLVGQLLITGKGPFDLDLPDAFKSKDGRTVNDAWLSKFKAQAQAKGWQTQMVWYRVVNDSAG